MKKLLFFSMALLCLNFARGQEKSKQERPLKAQVKEIKMSGNIPEHRKNAVAKAYNMMRQQADSMMNEIHTQLISDGVLNENRKRIILMFQYSDILNGPSTLGKHYVKYKAIFQRYFPGYDTFATTRAFSLK